MVIFITILLVICFLLGVLRFTLPAQGLDKKAIFKDIAHLFVGFLFGAAALSSILGSTIWELWAMAVGLTVLEVVAFISKKKSSG